MQKKNKKGILLAGLVIALGVAVYLNWQFAPSEDYIESGASSLMSESEELGEALLVSNDSVMTSEISDSDAVEASKQSDYFKEARTKREKAREESLTVLEEIINSASKSGADKADAVSRSAVIAQQIQLENAIETLVIAKGFEDCVAIVGETQISVIVPNTNELTASQVSVITDIVISQTNMPASCISIIQPKLNS